MDAKTLKTRQAPIKSDYRSNPEHAFITLKTQGRLADGVICRVETGKAVINAGLHPATGGDGLSLCSGDMLLEALVACAGVTLNAVSTATSINMKDAVVKAEGDIDFRGTLGVSKDAEVGFAAIRLSFLIDTDATQEEIDTLLKLTERYCVVYQTLSKGVPVETNFQMTTNS